MTNDKDTQHDWVHSRGVICVCSPSRPPAAALPKYLACHVLHAEAQSAPAAKDRSLWAAWERAPEGTIRLRRRQAFQTTTQTRPGYLSGAETATWAR